MTSQKSTFISYKSQIKKKNELKSRIAEVCESRKTPSNK